MRIQLWTCGWRLLINMIFYLFILYLFTFYLYGFYKYLAFDVILNGFCGLHKKGWKSFKYKKYVEPCQSYFLTPNMFLDDMCYGNPRALGIYCLGKEPTGFLSQKPLEFGEQLAWKKIYNSTEVGVFRMYLEAAGYNKSKFWHYSILKKEIALKKPSFTELSLLYEFTLTKIDCIETLLSNLYWKIQLFYNLRVAVKIANCEIWYNGRYMLLKGENI